MESTSSDASSSRTLIAVAVAAVLAVVGAVLWAGVGILTGYNVWYVAIAIGAGVGFGTARIAGEPGTLVKGLCGLFTVLAVLCGELMYYGYYAAKDAKADGLAIDWGAFIAASPDILMEGGAGTLFAFGGGLVGAITAARAAGGGGD